MPQPTESFSRSELIRAAGEQGVSITPEKLHRWKKTGLLDAPEQLSLGRGLGRPAVYPVSALAQVMMIAELLKRSRDLNIARWQLFLAGFPIGLTHLRKQLDREASRALERSAEAVAASDTDDDDIAQRYLDRIATKARKGARSPLFRYMSQSLGRGKLPDFIEAIARLGSTAFENENAGDRDLLSRIFPPEVRGSLPANTFSWFSDFVAPGPVLAALRSAPDETLLLARGEFLQVAAILQALANAAPGLGQVLALEMRVDPEWPLPNFFLLWLRHRENAQLRSVLNAIAEQVRQLSAASMRGTNAGC